jgi:GTPase
MLIDEAQLHIRAGHGGAGKVCFDTVPRSLGPTGGNGGNGGSVYVEGVSDLSALRQYRFKKDFFAQDGIRGSENKRTGAAGTDLILKVPIGTIIRAKLMNLQQLEGAEGSGGMHKGIRAKEFEVTRVGERILIAQGGLGGRGNFEFRSSKNPSPEYAQPGLPGEEFEAEFELRLIANVGLIGLPNAGKSSLLNELTQAAARVANYPFTTLEPNLGVYYPSGVLKSSDEEQKMATPLILADIPGLIEGASAGKGLGAKFLRHVERTNVLLHCVSAESAAVNEEYKTVRAELTKYDKALSQKPEYILLTKTDVVDEATFKKQMTALKRFKKPVLPVSIHNQEQLAEVKKLLDGLAP